MFRARLMCCAGGAPRLHDPFVDQFGKLTFLADTSDYAEVLNEFGLVMFF